MNCYNLKIDCKETMYVQHPVKRKKMLSLPGAGRYRKCTQILSLPPRLYVCVCVRALYIYVCVFVSIIYLFSYKNKLNQFPQQPEAWCWMVTIHKRSSLCFLLYWRLLKTFDMACKGADFCPLKVSLSLCRKRFQHFARVD